MENNKTNKETGKPKGFFARLFDKLDKKMQEKANSCKCCDNGPTKKKSCCG